jgi:RNA polymerase-interacting CarD/CdnL/TRCF family regulator
MRYGGYDAPYRYPSPYQEPDPKSEKRALNNHAKALQSELDFIEKRLSELEARDE